MMNLKKHRYFGTLDKTKSALARGRVGNAIGIQMCKNIMLASRQAQFTRWTRLVTNAVAKEVKKAPTWAQL
jgi:hypothetical protein